MENSQSKIFKDKTIDIFGSKWKLIFVDQLLTDDKIVADGITDSTNRTITIYSKQPSNEVQITLLHELIHAILNSGQYFNISRNESAVEFLARSFYSLIKQGVLQWKH